MIGKLDTLIMCTRGSALLPAGFGDVIGDEKQSYVFNTAPLFTCQDFVPVRTRGELSQKLCCGSSGLVLF